MLSLVRVQLRLSTALPALLVQRLLSLAFDATKCIHPSFFWLCCITTKRTLCFENLSKHELVSTQTEHARQCTWQGRVLVVPTLVRKASGDAVMGGQRQC